MRPRSVVLPVWLFLCALPGAAAMIVAPVKFLYRVARAIGSEPPRLCVSSALAPLAQTGGCDSRPTLANRFRKVSLPAAQPFQNRNYKTDVTKRPNPTFLRPLNHSDYGMTKRPDPIRPDGLIRSTRRPDPIDKTARSGPSIPDRKSTRLNSSHLV